MTHFRGIPVQLAAAADAPARSAWSAICDRERPEPRITTLAHEVTCPACRKILRLPALPNETDELERRYP